ncbi:MULTISPECIES: hypothetical protein [unclassified Streptomyces]|uniref:hypothetical protein n=1 Tax=unclassified Streptomyces TaxID=2593676 RepID=UPI0036560A0B
MESTTAHGSPGELRSSAFRSSHSTRSARRPRCAASKVSPTTAMPSSTGTTALAPDQPVPARILWTYVVSTTGEPVFYQLVVGRTGGFLVCWPW